MNITYNCDCEAWTKTFINLVLKDAHVGGQEFNVIGVDELRIYLKTKMWSFDEKAGYAGKRKGRWKEHTWIIKYEFKRHGKRDSVLDYVLFDQFGGQSTTRQLQNGYQIIDMSPGFISDGRFLVTRKEGDTKFERIRGQNN